MGRNARKRISYVLPLAESAGGHRLGVNGLAVDRQKSILYSGGRDGVICAWDLHLDLTADDTEHNPFSPTNTAENKPPPSSFRRQVQAHTHWVNDIVLAHNNDALISASSDITVKLWRPTSDDPLPPQTIGLHTDYVKRVASPRGNENWVASGGLDRKISLWDLNGAGKKLEIPVAEDENTAKGSVYALAVTPGIIASGGPESVVRVWDARTGKRITKFVGHTNNVRDVLVAEDGDTIVTGSSDQTIKVWSMTAGRCMYTLTMHGDSVWSLFSDYPQLSVFYSSDRSGIVAKSDVRNCAEMDEGISVAVCQEHEGVSRLVAAGGYIWTATSSSSINRWSSVDTACEIDLPESYKWHRISVSTLGARYPSPPSTSPLTNGAAPKIPLKALLRMSNAAFFPSVVNPKDTDTSTLTSTRKPTEVIRATDNAIITPCHSQPDYTIEGQNGLIKHYLLSDRRRVLTVDTAGEVLLWDLLQCAPVKSFGKKPLDDVVAEVQTKDSVAHWCGVDTRIGALTCVLEENYCFDAEMYADELILGEKIEFREDHRINLGKWILRYLFSNLIDEEIKRDEDFRAALKQEKQDSVGGIEVTKRPMNIQLPDTTLTGWNDAAYGPTSSSTLKANDTFYLPPQTPGLAIGLATPMSPPPSASRFSQNSYLSPTTEEAAQLELSPTAQSATGESVDYFGPSTVVSDTLNTIKPSDTKEDSTNSKEETVTSPIEPDTPVKKGKGMFGKKFNMSFNMKKFSTGTPIVESVKAATADEKSEDSDSRSTRTNEKVFENNFYGVVQRIRQSYEDQLTLGLARGKVETQICPSLPNETPVLKPPANTTILIQEDRPEAGGVADLFEGKVGSLGFQADLIEKAAPQWLAEVLLQNQLPQKEIVKVSFILEPYQNTLPSISSDGNNRLNANRMLRVRKILAYVAERIEPPSTQSDLDAALSTGKPLLKPEEYLELYCNNQLVSTTMTLASIRAHIWRGGGDVLLHYKANGRKEINMTYEGPQTGHLPPANHALLASSIVAREAAAALSASVARAAVKEKGEKVSKGRSSEQSARENSMVARLL